MKNRIRELRIESKMTQVRLSTELEVSQETVSAYESEKHYPSVASLIHLSKIFHASCDYILGLSPVRNPSVPGSLGHEEQYVVERFQRLPRRKKELFLAYLRGLQE